MNRFLNPVFSRTFYLLACLMVSTSHASSVPQATLSEQTESVWKDKEGKPVPDTDSRASRNGFGGAVVMTTDADWKAKWDTPQGSTPRFNVAEKIPYGKKAALLTFFANPALDKNGVAHITCDFVIVDPSGKTITAQKDLTCYEGKIAGSLLNTYLAAPVIDFVGEKGDPSGKWVFNVLLKDNVRNVAVPLKVYVDLQP